MKYILKYFQHLGETQKEQFEQMLCLYPEWNNKINVISRKDIDNLELHHILHSLSIAKFINFTQGSRILDFGCGGGFPGIPLAVIFPDVKFHLIDRTGKKLKVAQAITDECGIRNVSFQHGDIGECHEKFDFVVSRAVMPLSELVKYCRKNISYKQQNGYPNGLITLKGGELSDELKCYRGETIVEIISNWFEEDYFKSKLLTYSPL